jgi:hypothetical protein
MRAGARSWAQIDVLKKPFVNTGLSIFSRLLAFEEDWVGSRRTTSTKKFWKRRSKEEGSVRISAQRGFVA